MGSKLSSAAEDTTFEDSRKEILEKLNEEKLKEILAKPIDSFKKYIEILTALYEEKSWDDGIHEIALVLLSVDFDEETFEDIIDIKFRRYWEDIHAAEEDPPKTEENLRAINDMALRKLKEERSITMENTIKLEELEDNNKKSQASLMAETERSKEKSKKIEDLEDQNLELKKGLEKISKKKNKIAEELKAEKEKTKENFSMIQRQKGEIEKLESSNQKLRKLLEDEKQKSRDLDASLQKNRQFRVEKTLPEMLEVMRKKKIIISSLEDENERLRNYMWSAFKFLTRGEYGKCHRFIKIIVLQMESSKSIEVEEANEKLKMLKILEASSEDVSRIRTEIKNCLIRKNEFESSLESWINAFSDNQDFDISFDRIPTHATYLPVFNTETEKILENILKIR